MGSSSKWKIIYYYAITFKQMKAMSQQLYDQFDTEQTLRSYQSTRGKKKRRKKRLTSVIAFPADSVFLILAWSTNPFHQECAEITKIGCSLRIN